MPSNRSVGNRGSIKKKAMKLLRSCNFFVELLRALRRNGLVGEEQNALAVYIAATSRLLRNPLCIFIKGPSGTGKNFLADTVLRFIIQSEIFTFTSFSPKSWNFLGTKLSHKVVYLKELNEAAGPVEPSRLLISEGGLIHDTVARERGELKHKRRVTKGPIAAISTTTRDRAQVDDETRRISLWVDEMRCPIC